MHHEASHIFMIQDPPTSLIDTPSRKARLLLPFLCCLHKIKMMNSFRMQTSNTGKSASVQPPCLRRAQSLPNELGREIVGKPLFWFKANKRISKFKKDVCHDSKPPCRRLPQFPRLGRLRAHKMSPSVDLQIPDLLLLKPSSDTDGSPIRIRGWPLDSLETSDTIDDDTLSMYSTDDENENSDLHGLSFLDETE
jgi:hypothetical protein